MSLSGLSLAGLEDRPENYFMMIYTLQAAAGGTVLTITQEDPREAIDQVGDDEEENPVLAALKQLPSPLRP